MAPEYKDPRVIALDIGSTFVVLSKFLRGEEEPFTSEDCRAMSISAHIQADRNGYRGPVDERVVDSPDNGPEGEPVKPQGNGSYGEYRDQKQVASVKSINYMHVVIKDAIAKVREKKNLGLNAAEKEVKHNIMDTYEEYWDVTPNLTSPKGRMNQGQVSMVINYVKTEWELE